MKKLIFILILTFTGFTNAQQLIEVVPDSISVNFDFVEKGKHTVYFNGKALSPQHTKESKARFRAGALKAMHPNADIITEAPTGTPKVTIKVFMYEKESSKSLYIEADDKPAISSVLIDKNDQINIKGDLKEVTMWLPDIEDAKTITIINLTKASMIINGLTYFDQTNLTFLRNEGKWQLLKN